MSSKQRAQILKHLRDAGSISQREAMTDYSIQSLTSRIAELRKRGFNIKDDTRHHPVTGQRYKRYYMGATPVVQARGDGFVMYA